MHGEALTRRAVIRGALGLTGLSALAAVAGCSQAKPDAVPSDEGVEPAATVTAIDNAYEPAEVEISVGEAVRWEFAGSGEHDVVAEDGSFVSELMTEGSYTHVFETAGEFAYDCSIHPEMTGIVTVVQ